MLYNWVLLLKTKYQHFITEYLEGKKKAGLRSLKCKEKRKLNGYGTHYVFNLHLGERSLHFKARVRAWPKQGNGAAAGDESKKQDEQKDPGSIVVISTAFQNSLE